MAGSAFTTLSYSIMPLQPIARYRPTDTLSKRPGKNSFSTIPTAATLQTPVSNDIANTRSFNWANTGV